MKRRLARRPALRGTAVVLVPTQRTVATGCDAPEGEEPNSPDRFRADLLSGSVESVALAQVAGPLSHPESMLSEGRAGKEDEQMATAGTTALVFPSDPLRILVAGDTHGNIDWVRQLVALAIDHHCHALVQLGDFGWWPGEDAYLDEVSLMATSADLPFAFIDGNHDFHDARLYVCESRGWDRPIELRPGLFHLPRGVRWVWSGIRFGALGGAFSVDWRYRTNYVNWWRKDEGPNQDDVDRLGDEALDVLFTHDAPLSVPLRGMSLPEYDQLQSDATRALLDEAVRRTRPRLVAHGHWHHRYRHDLLLPDVEVRGAPTEVVVRVEGLAHDGTDDGRAWGILELPALQFRDGREVESDAGSG